MTDPTRKAERQSQLRIDHIQGAIIEYSTQLLARYPDEPQAWKDRVLEVRQMLMWDASHPTTDHESFDIESAPWPKPGEYSGTPEPEPEPQPVIEAEPVPDPRDAEIEALRAKIAELETQPLGYPDEAPEPYTPDFTLIPEALAKYAEADEDVTAFRNRLKSYWQRFGIEDGMNFPGGGEPLTGEEKIQMRDIDMLLNSEEGRNARLHDWLFAD